MSAATLPRLGADLDQVAAETEVAAFSTAVRLDAEAQRLAANAASMGLFGLDIRLDPSALYEDATEPYRVTDAAPELVAANDGAPPSPSRTFPQAPPRPAHLSPALPAWLMKVCDWLAIACAAQAAALWGAGQALGALPLGEALAFVFAAAGLKLGLWLTEAYRACPGRMQAEKSAAGLALGALVGVVVGNVLAPDARGAAALAAVLPAAAFVLAGLHAALAVLANALHRKGVFAENIIVIAATPAAEALVKRAQRTGEARVVAIVDDRLARAPGAVCGAPVVGNVAALAQWPDLPHIDRIIIAAPPSAETRVQTLLASLRALPHRIDVALDYGAANQRDITRIGKTMLVCLSGSPRNHARVAAKRAQDVALSTIALLVTAPALVTLMALLRLENGTALRRRAALGLFGRRFETLTFDTRGHGPISTLVRRSGLERLPQVLNVMRGEMSFVGPTAHAPDFSIGGRAAQAICPTYGHRLRVKPGLVEIASLPETPSALRRALHAELDYVTRMSLWHDMQALAQAIGQRKRAH